MSGPYGEDSFFGADSCASGVTTWSEPMVLRSSCSPSSNSRIGDTIYCLSKYSVKEMDIIRYNTCSQMVLEVVAAFNYSIDVTVTIGNNHLEGTEEFSTAEIEIVDELFKTDLNGCGFI